MNNMICKYCLYVREDLAQLKEDFFYKKDLNGMKSDTYMYRDLKEFLYDNNIDLNTQYINAPQDSEVIICLNETEYFLTYKKSQNNRLLVLILTEPPVYNYIDWTPERHKLFDLIFTYDSDLVNMDKSKYRHINFPIDFEPISEFVPPTEEIFKSKKNASLVAGAIAITHSKDDLKSLLYERYKIIRWYNKNKQNSLHFYSRTAPLSKFECFRGASVLNKINKKITKKIASILYKCSISKVYNGAIPSLNKKVVLYQYKFNYCLENSMGIKGLISEKIFDCFMAQTIPIYYGAPDIAMYIPKNCYILYTDFNNIKELEEYINKMNYKTYLQYIINANDFMKNASSIFSTKNFITKIYKETTL